VFCLYHMIELRTTCKLNNYSVWQGNNAKTRLMSITIRYPIMKSRLFCFALSQHYVRSLDQWAKASILIALEPQFGSKLLEDSATQQKLNLTQHQAMIANQPHRIFNSSTNKPGNWSKLYMIHKIRVSICILFDRKSRSPKQMGRIPWPASLHT